MANTSSASRTAAYLFLFCFFGADRMSGFLSAFSLSGDVNGLNSESADDWNGSSSICVLS